MAPWPDGTVSGRELARREPIARTSSASRWIADAKPLMVSPLRHWHWIDETGAAAVVEDRGPRLGVEVVDGLELHLGVPPDRRVGPILDEVHVLDRRMPRPGSKYCTALVPGPVGVSTRSRPNTGRTSGPAWAKPPVRISMSQPNQGAWASPTEHCHRQLFGPSAVSGSATTWSM